MSHTEAGPPGRAGAYALQVVWPHCWRETLSTLSRITIFKASACLWAHVMTRALLCSRLGWDSVAYASW